MMSLVINIVCGVILALSLIMFSGCVYRAILGGHFGEVTSKGIKCLSVMAVAICCLVCNFYF